MELLLKIYEWISRRGKVASIVFIILAILASGEGAQNQLFGDATYRIAASILPWHPLFLGRAALEAEFVLLDESGSPGKTINIGRSSGRITNCPVDSKIGFSYSRSRSGWVAVFGVTNIFDEDFDSSSVYSLEKKLVAQKVSGNVQYKDGVAFITKAEGSELFVIVGSDKPFDPMDEIVPQLRKLKRINTKGGGGVLSGYSVAWSDNPIFGECYSRDNN